MTLPLIKTICLAGCINILALGTANAENARNDIDRPRATPATTAAETGYLSTKSSQFQAYVTGYSFWDNTPPGSARIARPVIHRQAGGTGTYADPITVAVGHSRINGRSRMDFPAGTRFYFPRLQKYGIVEDLCGDGPRPQNGPCHTGYGGLAWLDIYVGGRDVGAHSAERCMYAITGVQHVLMNPPPGLTVHPGEIAMSTCQGI